MRMSLPARTFCLVIPLWGVLALAQAQAQAQTNVKVGDRFNMTGATRVVDMSKLDPLHLKTGSNQDTPVDLRKTPLTQWMGGMAAGQWAALNGSDGPAPYPAWSNLYGNGDAEVYPNGDLLATGKVRNPMSIVGGKLIIQPVLLNAAESALVASVNKVGGGYKPTVLSGAVNTFPYGLNPPFAFGVKATLPAEMPRVPGYWPAWWLLSTAGDWPPEIDVMDGYITSSRLIFRYNAGAQPNNGLPAAGGAQALMTPGEHSWLGIVYPDIIAFYFDGICTQIIPGGPAILNRAGQPELWYGIINLAFQGRANSWPSSLSPTKRTFQPMTVSDVYFLAMPTTYPGPGDGVTIPTMTGTVVAVPPAPRLNQNHTADRAPKISRP